MNVVSSDRSYPNAHELELLPWDEHNRALIAHVHPRTWKNPRAEGRYNLVVVGGGTAGLVSAMGAAGLGARVALVERGLLGGDCLNYGCVPSKALIRAARAAFDARQASAFGVRTREEPTVDFAAVMERMRRLRAGIAPHDSARRLADSGVDVFLGVARFVAPDALEVEGQRLSFARAVITAGARAATLPIPGLVEAGYLTNETIFSLTTLPKKLGIIGAGPIGCELAQAFRRLGAEVVVLSKDPQVLPREDADAAALLAQQLMAEGVELVRGATILSVSRESGRKSVSFERDHGPESVLVDELLVATGRAANVEGLGLDAAGIAFGSAGIVVDDRLRTTNRRVYAAGDICSVYQFTHAADAMARIALQNALFWGRKRASALVIPWATYTDPEIAHVGLYEQQARERGIDVQTLTVPLTQIDRAVLDGDSEGFARLHIEPGKGRILGATLVARHAGEMISEISLAMAEGLSAGALSRTIHPYPTHAEVWKRLGDSYNRTRLKPWIKRILLRYFAWKR